MRVVILRGISGSGKSTWAKSQAPGALVVSADDYFVQPDETRAFDRAQLRDAHHACYRSFLSAVQKQTPYIIVDNTNIAVWEISPYVLLAKIFGYEVEILTFMRDPEIAIRRKRWVPEEHVRGTARRLSEETRKFPAFMKEMHRIVQNCP